MFYAVVTFTALLLRFVVILRVFAAPITPVTHVTFGCVLVTFRARIRYYVLRSRATVVGCWFTLYVLPVCVYCVAPLVASLFYLHPRVYHVYLRLLPHGLFIYPHFSLPRLVLHLVVTATFACTPYLRFRSQLRVYRLIRSFRYYTAHVYAFALLDSDWLTFGCTVAFAAFGLVTPRLRLRYARSFVFHVLVPVLQFAFGYNLRLPHFCRVARCTRLFTVPSWFVDCTQFTLPLAFTLDYVLRWITRRLPHDVVYRVCFYNHYTA